MPVADVRENVYVTLQAALQRGEGFYAQWNDVN